MTFLSSYRVWLQYISVVVTLILLVELVDLLQR
jgi:hypothetical protein